MLITGMLRLFAIVDKNTLNIEAFTRNVDEPYDEALYEKIEVGKHDTKSQIKFVRGENGEILKKEPNVYGLVDRKSLELKELINETEYENHDDNVFALVTFTVSEIQRLGPSTLRFNDDFTYYSDASLLSKHEGFKHIRNRRNTLLAETDWMMVQDSPLNDEKLELIKIYRQKLRDITSNTHPDDVVFPDKPFDF